MIYYLERELTRSVRRCFVVGVLTDVMTGGVCYNLEGSVGMLPKENFGLLFHPRSILTAY